MNGKAFRGVDRRQRGLDVAGNAEVVAVDMQRMRHAELVHRSRQRPDDRARRHAVMRHGIVDAERAAIELEGADAAGIDHLDRMGGGRPDHPGDVVVDLALRGATRQPPQQELVIPQHDVGALVEDGDVGHLHMGRARVRRHHRRLEGGGIAHRRIAVAGGEGRGRGKTGPAPQARTFRELHVLAVIRRRQQPSQIDLAAGDVAVDVDGASHHQLARDVMDRGGLSAIGGRRNDAIAVDPDIALPLGRRFSGIDDAAASETQHHRPASRPARMACAASARPGCLSSRVARSGKVITASERTISPP